MRDVMGPGLNAICFLARRGTSGEVGPSNFLKEKIYDKENRSLQKDSRLTSDTLYGQESGQFHYAAGSWRSGRTLQRYSKQKEKAV